MSSHDNEGRSSTPHSTSWLVEQLKVNVDGLLKKENEHFENISRLETDLRAYKHAYAGLEEEQRTLENVVKELHLKIGELDRDCQDLQKEKLELESTAIDHRIAVLIDGDGAIFSLNLILHGAAGGQDAAQLLSDWILNYLKASFGPNPYQLWVKIFLNKRGLMEALSRSGHIAVRKRFEDFLLGFSQASERFLIVDVGGGKEAADSKIKAHLEDDLKISQICKVILGGCHDNGYVSNLRSHMTAGYKHKLVLLESYADLAAGIAELELPRIAIPDLFLQQKLGSLSNIVNGPSSLGVAQCTSGAISDVTNEHPKKAQVAVDHHSARPTRRSSASASYSSVLSTHASNRRGGTPELDSSSGTSSSEDEIPDAAPVNLRRVNPKIPLSKHKPPPCTLFYLANCKHGSDCKYSHNYLLNADHLEEIRGNAKKAPCPFTNKNEPCFWGDSCFYGHHCSLSTKCHYFKQGRCKFLGADMHKEPKFEDDKR